MTRRRMLLSLVLLFLAGGVLSLPAVHWRLIGWWRGEAFYQGRPTSYWSGRVRQWVSTLTPSTPVPLPVAPSNWQRLLQSAGLAPSAMPTFPEVLGTSQFTRSPLDAAAVPVLIELMRDEDASVRRTAAWALTVSDIRSADPQVVPVLIEIWQSQEYDWARTWAAEAAWRLDPEAAARAGIAKPEP